MISRVFKSFVFYHKKIKKSPRVRSGDLSRAVRVRILGHGVNVALLGAAVALLAPGAEHDLLARASRLVERELALVQLCIQRGLFLRAGRLEDGECVGFCLRPRERIAQGFVGEIVHDRAPPAEVVADDLEGVERVDRGTII